MKNIDLLENEENQQDWSFVLEFRDSKWDSHKNIICVTTNDQTGVNFTVKCKHNQNELDAHQIFGHHPISTEDSTTQCGCKMTLGFRNLNYKIGLVFALFDENGLPRSLSSIQPTIDEKLLKISFMIKEAGGKMSRIRFWVKKFGVEEEKTWLDDRTLSLNKDCNCLFCPMIRLYRKNAIRHVRNRSKFQEGRQIDTSVDPQGEEPSIYVPYPYYHSYTEPIIPSGENMHYYTVPNIDDPYTPQHSHHHVEENSVPSMYNNVLVNGHIDQNPFNSWSQFDFPSQSSRNQPEPQENVQPSIPDFTKLLDMVETYQEKINSELNEMKKEIKGYLTQFLQCST